MIYIKKAFPQSIHVACIGGIGMSGVARLLVEQGFTVTGSDKKLLESKTDYGVELCSETSLPSHTHLLICSSAMDQEHPQIKQAMVRNISTMHRVEAVNILLADKKVLGMMGSHGKTSSSGILANILHDQTFLIGGMHQNREVNAKWCSGEWCAFETDESDGSFAKANLFGGLLITLDYEHLSYYDGSFEKMFDTFVEYFKQVKKPELFFVNIDDENSAKLAKLLPQLGTYGTSADAQYRLENIRGRVYDLVRPDGTIMKDLELGIFGRHFIQNSAGVVALCDAISISEEQIRTGLKTFKGVQRRLTKLGNWQEKSIFDDYAHHPAEILASLQALQEEYKKILIFYEPHKYTRTKDTMQDLIPALELADKAYLLPIYAASEEPIEGITSENIVKQSNNLLLSANMLEEIKFFDGDCVVCMGAGNSSKIIKDVFAELIKK